MIQSFKSRALKRFWIRGQTHAIAAELVDKVTEILSALDAARDPGELDLPGYHLHPLTGDLADFWSVRVTANMRLIFRMQDGDALDVDFLDYH